MRKVMPLKFLSPVMVSPGCLGAGEFERFVVRLSAIRFALRLAHEMAEGQEPRSINALAEDRKQRSRTKRPARCDFLKRGSRSEMIPDSAIKNCWCIVGAQKVEWGRVDSMNKQRRERSTLYPKILFGFTSHPITVWAGSAVGRAIGGGAVLFTGHLEAVVFTIWISRSNRGERAVDAV